jgi:hypothetical protein
LLEQTRGGRSIHQHPCQHPGDHLAWGGHLHHRALAAHASNLEDDGLTDCCTGELKRGVEDARLLRQRGGVLRTFHLLKRDAPPIGRYLDRLGWDLEIRNSERPKGV